MVWFPNLEWKISKGFMCISHGNNIDLINKVQHFHGHTIQAVSCTPRVSSNQNLLSYINICRYSWMLIVLLRDTREMMSSSFWGTERTIAQHLHGSAPKGVKGWIDTTDFHPDSNIALTIKGVYNRVMCLNYFCYLESSSVVIHEKIQH